MGSKSFATKLEAEAYRKYIDANVYQRPEPQDFLDLLIHDYGETLKLLSKK